MSDQISSLFVYGTLQPGDVRWSLLAPFVADTGVVDAADGTLYDTGLGFPAAIFGIGDDRIHGRVYHLHLDKLDEALTALDAEESSVPGRYTRITITTRGGREAWAYQVGGGLDLTPIEDGWWRAPSDR